MKHLTRLIRLTGIGNSIQLFIGAKSFTVTAYDRVGGYGEILAVVTKPSAEEAVEACCVKIEAEQFQKMA